MAQKKRAKKPVKGEELLAATVPEGQPATLPATSEPESTDSGRPAECLEQSPPEALPQPAPESPEPEPAQSFPIVGIGASAGGLTALEAFFSALPPGDKNGAAFVIVQHLSPNHASILGDIVKRYTQMNVHEVIDGMTVEPNSVYVIPPNRDMAFLNGTLQLLEPTAARGLRLPIDFFFRSLAQDQGERAICIILSGTGSDGTLGLRAIKGEGGLVMVQQPESADYDGMPRSAIATGLVDYIVPPKEMPAKLLSFAHHALGKKASVLSMENSSIRDSLLKICILLRAETGHDFSQYKESTLIRRIERRMAIHKIDRPGEYLTYLQRTRTEVDALFRELLIGVTSFFRDPEAFEALAANCVSQLLAKRPPSGMIRVWVCGCSTGEEAYSIAILFQERIEEARQTFKVQIFATDIDKHAIEQARAGVYPASIAADITPERLARYFIQDPDGGCYRVQKVIRDLIVFSEQDVIKDPPFSKIDLISCRNLLIYMGGELQKRVISLFHYALSPGGMLFLGTSESAGDSSLLFMAVDRKAKLFTRRDVASESTPLSVSSFIPPSKEQAQKQLEPARELQGKINLREVAEQALWQHLEATGVLVDANGEILYVIGRTGKFLEVAPGALTTNIISMAREGLRQELTVALKTALIQKGPVCFTSLKVKTNGGFTLVDLTVRPVALSGKRNTLPSDAYLVVLEESRRHPELHAAPANAKECTLSVRSRIAALERELRAKDEQLRSALEQMETSNEELKSANEEMQSVNEELQSTNEELETSKEELQSVNEELATVNAELQTKVADLSQANNDMNNLLAGTGVATLFVDHQLRIVRFTPAAMQLINMIQSDVGRPVGHLVSNLKDYNSLVEDVNTVLSTLVPFEREVETKTGSTYVMGIRPYRTLQNVIEGAVITFVDVGSIRQGLAAGTQRAERKYRALFRRMTSGVIFHDRAGNIIESNVAAESILGSTLQEIRDTKSKTPPCDAFREDGSVFPWEAQPVHLAFSSGQTVKGVVMGIRLLDRNGVRWILADAIPLTEGREPAELTALIFEDISTPSPAKLAPNTQKASEG